MISWISIVYFSCTLHLQVSFLPAWALFSQLLKELAQLQVCHSSLYIYIKETIAHYWKVAKSHINPFSFKTGYNANSCHIQTYRFPKQVILRDWTWSKILIDAQFSFWQGWSREKLKKLTNETIQIGHTHRKRLYHLFFNTAK